MFGSAVRAVCSCCAAFVINVAAVLYLLMSKRLFGLRSGRKADDDERRGERLLDVERAAVA
jgi:hypothetical protein